MYVWKKEFKMISSLLKMKKRRYHNTNFSIMIKLYDTSVLLNRLLELKLY
jgi:hypothetical protein